MDCSRTPTTYGTSLPTLPTWPTAFPTRASSPTERPPASFPRTSSSSFATWALAYGTGPQHRLAITPYSGMHARTCQNYLPLQHLRTTSGNTREPDKSHCAGTLRHFPSHLQPPSSLAISYCLMRSRNTPQPPMTLPVPEDWLQDSDCGVLDTSCPPPGHERRELLAFPS